MVTAFVKRKVQDAGRIQQAALESLSQETVAEPVLEAAYLPGQVRNVPLRLIRPNPVNARAIYSASALGDLVEAIKRTGQETAALGFQEGGDVVLIDGHRRFQAVQALGGTHLRVEIRAAPHSEKDLYLSSWTVNRERASQTPLDDALVWRGLLDRRVFASQAELARATGVSETEVSRTLALAALRPQVVQLLSEKPELLTYKMLNALREFEQVHGPEKTSALVLEVAANGYGYREVEARRRRLESDPRTRATPVSRKVEYRKGVGTLKEFVQDGRVELSLRGLPPEEAKELVAKLTALLNEAGQL